LLSSAQITAFKCGATGERDSESSQVALRDRLFLIVETRSAAATASPAAQPSLVGGALARSEGAP
jgi:hypothetical protein